MQASHSSETERWGALKVQRMRRKAGPPADQLAKEYLTARSSWLESRLMSTRLPAIPFEQHKTKMYIAAVPPTILDSFSIDIWNPKNILGRRGYQRRPDERRIRNIAKYLERRRSIMPVAGLLNVRQKGRMRFKDGKLTIPDGTDVWVVDMQHRLKGIVEALEHGALSTANFHFPVVITKAKKMDVALTRRLLIENDRVQDIADVKPWEIAAVRITIELNKSIKANPWFDALRQPNEDRLHQHIATEKSFVNSLRQLLISGRYKQPKKAAKKLALYWSAIREAIPEAFHEPRKYLIRKTPGMFVFNFFIAPGIFVKHEDSDFDQAVSGLKKLGPAFWQRTDKRGARRFGTGMGGYANLSDYLKGLL
jgi:DGQHR domain-containing protein